MALARAETAVQVRGHALPPLHGAADQREGFVETHRQLRRDDVLLDGSGRVRHALAQLEDVIRGVDPRHRAAPREGRRGMRREEADVEALESHVYDAYV